MCFRENQLGKEMSELGIFIFIRFNKKFRYEEHSTYVLEIEGLKEALLTI